MPRYRFEFEFNSEVPSRVTRLFNGLAALSATALNIATHGYASEGDMAVRLLKQADKATWEDISDDNG